MPPKSKTNLLLWVAFFSLLTGLINYYLLNSSLFKFKLSGLYNQRIVIHNRAIRCFFHGYFSDICWCIALYFVLVAMTINDKLNAPGKALLLMTPVIAEAGQYFSFLPGVFDWYDIFVYSALLLLFCFLYPPIIPFKMKTLKKNLYAASVSGIFIIMALACAPTKTSYKPPRPQPCIKHAALSYSPILVKINISGSYTMKDLSGAQRLGYEYLMDALNNLTAYKYKLADGVKPNLELNVTINTDSYQHYGAALNGYVYDGDFYFDWSNDYVTPERLFDDIAKQVNMYITKGWCKNCPDPCIIN
jgi:hypothetical protein